MIPLKIEKGIPIPRRYGRVGDLRATIERMKIMDSILLDSESICCCALMAAKRSGMRCTSRKVENGWRVWRVK